MTPKPKKMAAFIPCRCACSDEPHHHIDSHTFIPWDEFKRSMNMFMQPQQTAGSIGDTVKLSEKSYEMQLLGDLATTKDRQPHDREIASNALATRVPNDAPVPSTKNTCDECGRDDPGEEPGWYITVYNTPSRSGLVCPECVRRGVRKS